MNTGAVPKKKKKKKREKKKEKKTITLERYQLHLTSDLDQDK